MYNTVNQFAPQCLSSNVIAKNDENVPINLLKKFLNDNPKNGYLIFQVFEESPISGLIPVPNAKITVSGVLENGVTLSQVFMSNEDGKTEPITLPTVSRDLSYAPSNILPYTKYDASVESSQFYSVNVHDIPIYDNITSIQPIKLLPILVPQSSQLLAWVPKLYHEGR